MDKNKAILWLSINIISLSLVGWIKKLNRKLPLADYDYETSQVSVITSTTPTPTPTPANQAKAQFFLTVFGGGAVRYDKLLLHICV